jgi:ribosomal protein S28E/S33
MRISDILKFDSYLTKNIRGPSNAEDIIEMEEY